MDQLERERAEVEVLAVGEVDQLDVAQLVLLELGARHRHRQRPAVDGRRVVAAELAQHPRQRAEVVLVAVGDDDRLDVVDAVAQVGEVGQHEVDADHLRGREAQPDVDDDDPAVVLDDGHVLADLAEAAERQHPQRAAHAFSASSRWWRTSISRTASRSCAVGLDQRQAQAADRWPSSSSAAFVQVGLAVRNSVL